MARVEDFFIMDNAVTGITDEDYRNIQDVVDSVDAFSRMTYKSVYIIDYFKKNFLYVSENPLFLCGLSSGLCPQASTSCSSPPTPRSRARKSWTSTGQGSRSSSASVMPSSIAG